MKYGDDLDRIPPAAGLSRRQFLTAGGGRAARIAAGVLLPGVAKRPAAPAADGSTPDDSDELPDHREG